MTEEDEKLADELDVVVEFIRRMGGVTRNPSLDFAHRKQAMKIQQIVANEAVSEIEKSAEQSRDIASKVYRKEQLIPVRFSPRKSVVDHNARLAERVELNAESSLSFSKKRQTERLFYEIDFIAKRVAEYRKWYESKLVSVNKLLLEKGRLDLDNTDPEFTEIFHPFVRESIKKAKSVFPSVDGKRVYLLCELPIISEKTISSWIDGIRIICEGDWLVAKQSFPDICLRVDKEVDARLSEKKLKVKEKFYILPDRKTHWGDVVKRYSEALSAEKSESSRLMVRKEYKVEPDEGTHLPEFVEKYQMAWAKAQEKPTAADMKRHWTKALKGPLKSFLRGKI